MNIAIAAKEDIPELVKLINSAYRGDTSRTGWTTEANLLGGSRIDDETFEQMMFAEKAVVLTYSDPETAIIGCVYLQQQQSKLYLGMLTVSPEIQNHGVGKQLLQSAETYAQRHSCVAIFMTVISVRAELIAWYERHGYLKTGETRPFPKDTKFGIALHPLELIILEKKL
jgi:ribosomal protein S18 acetylase RimI-like enzyme